MTQYPNAEHDQSRRYEHFYDRFRKVRRFFRFDIRYRCRRLHEVFAQLGMSMENKRVIDVGFGGGDLLASFPSSCDVIGVDISSSAVLSARRDKLFARFRGARFDVVAEAEPESIPVEKFDVVVSSHMLEHVPDDEAVLRTIHARLDSGGVLALFVPIEEPDYISFHRRNYSVQSITRRVQNAGFKVLFTEGSMYVNGHIWKVLTIPSRRHWPVIRHLSDALRLGVLSSIPYPLLRLADGILHRLGFGARQALVLACTEH